MSWFARSIANTLNLDDDEEEEEDHHDRNDTDKSVEGKNLIDSPSSTPSPPSPGRGVKEDLSELTQTLTRQFWGVASFLAPPPPPDSPQISESDPNEPSEGRSDLETSDPERITGIRSDLAEIGGKFRTGISNLSRNIDVSEITKLASNFLQLGPEEEDYDTLRGVVGVTEDVVAFVRDIAMHPGTWLDFPLPEDEDEDFDMTDAQQEHALAVERFAPRLAALRIELCPGYMSERRFWKIYFVLLHPRLDIHDAELLSTPHIMKARASLTQESKKSTNSKPEEGLLNTGTNTSYSKDITESPHKESLSVSPPSAKSEPVAVDFETDKHPVLSADIQIIDKSVIQEGPVNQNNGQNSLSRCSSKAIEIKDEDDGDDWLKEENPETGGASGPTISIDNDEDVSFSDLEDEDEDDGHVPTSYKRVTHCSDNSTKDTADWVQLRRSSDDSVPIEHTGSEQVSTRNHENKESNDWLDVDDIDVA